MAWGQEASWSLIWQGPGGWSWARCSVAPGNLSNIDKPNYYGCVPHCMEFDSGGNGVRETSRTGLPWMIPAMTNRTRWLGNGDWPSFKIWGPSWHKCVASATTTTTHQLKFWTRLLTLARALEPNEISAVFCVDCYRKKCILFSAPLALLVLERSSTLIFLL